MAQFSVNGESASLDIEGEMPLLWVLREEMGKRGTKFGCGKGLCGACTVHVNGVAVRSCVTPVAAAEGAEVTTIEGLGNPDAPHAIQRAWIEHQVPQCGYCQCGMQMAAAAFLASNPAPTEADIDAGISNLCRCGCYERIRAAILDAASTLQAESAAAGAEPSVDGGE